MIDPKELRIGNRVKCTISNDAGIYQVLALPMWELAPYENEPHITIDRCSKQLVARSKLKPIPLTPEILTKCGFEKSEYEKKEQWLGPEVIRVQPYTKYRICLMVEPFGFYYQEAVIQIRTISLHQLQNLYFALTGTELEVNL